MKYKLIFCLLLFSLTSLAQPKDVPTPNEALRTPVKPIIVEGELTNVPDGTIIIQRSYP